MAEEGNQRLNIRRLHEIFQEQSRENFLDFIGQYLRIIMDDCGPDSRVLDLRLNGFLYEVLAAVYENSRSDILFHLLPIAAQVLQEPRPERKIALILAELARVVPHAPSAD